jgi:hypothetical protein
MSAPTNHNGTEWLALTGVGLGLIVALIVDRTMMDGMTDRPVVITGITAMVAMLWIVTVRLFVWSPTAPITVSKPKP